MTIQHPFIKFVRLFHHQSFTLYGIFMYIFCFTHLLWFSSLSCMALIQKIMQTTKNIAICIVVILMKIFRKSRQSEIFKVIFLKTWIRDKSSCNCCSIILKLYFLSVLEIFGNNVGIPKLLHLYAFVCITSCIKRVSK